MPINKKKRSKFLDYFVNSAKTNDPENNKNHKIKKVIRIIWKVAKIISFVFLLTIALTACVQLLAFKTGTIPGSGFEYYTKREEASPIVKTFKYNEITKIYEINNEDIKYIHKDYTKPLIEQSEKDFSTYGEGYSSSVVFDDEKEIVKGNAIKAPYSKNGRYLFRYQPTQKQEELNRTNNNLHTYEPLNNFDNVLGHKLVDYLVPSQKILSINKDEIKYLMTKDNALVTYKVTDPNKIEHIHFSRIGLMNPKNIDEIYARDVLSSLLEKTFTQKYYVDALKEIKQTSVLDFINSLVTYDEEKNIYNPVDKELSQPEKVLLDTYIKAVTSYFRLLGYQIDSQDVAPYKANLKFSEATIKQNIYNPDYQTVLSSWLDAWKIDHFHALVAFPLIKMMTSFLDVLPYGYGWSSILVIIVSVIVVRLIALAITRKSLFSQQKQQELTPKKAKIEAKYASYKGNKMMENRKRMEIQDLYKKNGLNMFSPIIMAVVSMPIFLAMYRGINSIPELKSTTWLGITFSANSTSSLLSGGWVYLPLLILAITMQAISMLLPMILTAKRNKERTNLLEKQQIRKQNRIQYIMIAIFSFFILAINAGVQIYWILGGIWTISQTLAIHYIICSKWYKRKQEQKKLKEQEIDI
ncbi:membrane protein insertase YidC [Mycoplasma phocimorsus]|uniref:membrane protein insertase YidC n=1 Tax=Mycoplasma phocimorsus TaxID=3045839 RepID=UPI0024C0B589|nr:membrane protein insertase YidC [Mycoplasma phocimorsus]MDJ1646364.1 membrane protein insertase YidC [Mycoplasma phocimorsus]